MDIQTINQFLQSLLQGFLQSFLSQMIVITVVFVLIWKLFASRLMRFRIQQSQRAGWVQIRDEIINSLIVIAGGLITTPMILVLQQKGYTKIYFDPSEYGIGYLIFNTIFIWMVSDAWFYFAHRLLHHPKLYRYIHAIHHQSLDTTPYTTLSFHVLEPIILTAYIYILIFVMPISVIALGINQFFGLLNNIKSHLGYEFYPKFFDRGPLKYLVNSTHHNQHHTRYNGNYGLAFRFWDILFGTEFDDYEELVSQVKNRSTPESINDNSTYRTLKISKIVAETAETSSIYFEPDDENFYNYLHGQHINLRIKVQGKVYHRVFSLSSSPVVDRFLRITVKQNRVVTDYLRHTAKVGDEVEALYPAGDFGIQLKAEQAKHYMMIVGGSGITPIYSMIRSILAVEKKSSVTLLYANRRQENAAFAREIDALTQQSERFTALSFISGQRRIDKAALAQVLQAWSNSEVYICGPANLKTLMKIHLNELGVSRERLHEEEFADGFVSVFQRLALRA